MMLPLLLGSVLAGPADFPWAQGYLDPGRTLAQPLLFTQSYTQPGPPPQGWSRAPLPVTPTLVWAPRPVSVGPAELTPGVPEPIGQTWRVPVALRLTVSGPAIVSLRNLNVAAEPGLRAPVVYPSGQEFLRLDLDGLYTQQGRPLKVSELAGRVLTLRRLEQQRAVFSAEGLGEVVREGDPAGLTDLAPLIADPELAALKRRYEGKPVWGYSGLHVSCALSANAQAGYSVPYTQAIRVRRVIRLGKPLGLNVQGGPGDEVGRGADALTLTPLVFLLDAAPFGFAGDFAASSSGPPPATPPSPDPMAGAPEDISALLAQADQPGNCGLNVVYTLMGPWAAERVFSLTPPSARVPRALPANTTGLTRWQYAWLSGFPSSIWGTLSELMTLPQWQYRNIPFASTVRFDAAGRVSGVEAPRLP